jgi:hypothetical protein
MSLNGISRLGTKQLRQEAKLAIAAAKRQGKTVASDGTISGNVDPTKPYYRVANTLDINSLPTKYVGNSVFDNPITGGSLWSPAPVTSDNTFSLDFSDSQNSGYYFLV